MRIKLKRNYLLYYAIVITALVLLFSFYKLYLTNVIISGPVKINILTAKGDSASKCISVFGYSPTEKTHSFFETHKNNWFNADYSNYKSLYIVSSQQITLGIDIKTNYSAININDLNDPVILNQNNSFINYASKNYPNIYLYNITSQLKGEISVFEVLRLMLQWRDIRLLIVTLIVVSVILLLYFKNRQSVLAYYTKNIFKQRYCSSLKQTKLKLYAILIIFIGFLIHVMVYVYFGRIIITSGLIAKLVMFIFLYYAAISIAKFFKRTKRIRELKLFITTIALTILYVEFFLLISGFTDTYLEKRFHPLFYNSYYNKSYLTNWYKINNGKQFYLISSEFKYFRSVNSIGLSDIEYPVEKEENEYRIIGLGDSFTEGDGAHADSTWVKFLERAMTVYDENYKLTFINAGICGSDPYFEYVLLRDKLLQYSPDLVILAINRSDIDDLFIRGGWERFLDNGKLKYNAPPWWEPIFASSRISRLVFYALGYNQMLFKPSEVNTKKVLDKIIEVLYAFNDLATKHNFHLTIIFHPVNYEIYKNKMDLDAVKDSLKVHAAFDILDMLEYFNTIEGIKPSNSSNYFWTKDGHHNAKGYEAFAKGVEWHLSKNGIIDHLKQNEQFIK